MTSDRGTPAVQGVSFQVRSGEIVGIAGVDGNGQTELVQALTGLRPTWKLGERSAGPNPKLNFYFRGAYVDPSLVFNDGPNTGSAADTADKRNGKPENPERKRSKMQLAALETLHLDPDATLQDVKTRFKELVKRFHPDANGGDRGAEERLRQVIKAYGQLRSSGYS